MNDEPVPESTDDAHLLAALGEALGSDPAPAGLIERADALFAVKDLDATLATLLDRPAAEPAGMRGGTRGDRLEFAAADGSTALELVPHVDRLVGQVLAAQPVEAVLEAVLERPEGVAATTTVDELGRFSFASVPAGPARVRLVGRDTVPVITEWFLL